MRSVDRSGSFSGGELSSVEFWGWLASWKHVSTQLEVILTALRKRQLSGAHQCAKATSEVVRAMLGSCKFQNTDMMMKSVRALGRELMAASPAELVIGNIIRRVLYIIREEYSQKLRAVENVGIAPPNPGSRRGPTSSRGSDVQGGEKRDRSASATSSTSVEEAATRALNQAAVEEGGIFADQIDIEHYEDSLAVDTSIHMSSGRSIASPVKRVDSLAVLSLADYADPAQQPSLGSVLGQHSSTEKLDFQLSFPDMRQSVIGSINELNDELDNINQTLSETAQEQIHEDECILTFGYSQPVESFLRAASRKRKFQVIIAEAEPSMSGHKLAHELSKQSNISVTIIPDSGVFALMARVNKVLFSPHAVLVDGGAICVAGNLMVAVAAKQYSVPVVGIAGTYKLTPLFSHTQDRVLNNLLCPCDAVKYDEDGVCFDNVAVVIPASDYIPPELINLYVTNNGSHQPSYVYRLMSEYYHPKDHVLD